MTENYPFVFIGDSFGELALLKATTRAATVVCLEKTEFFVVDHDAFFK